MTEEEGGEEEEEGEEIQSKGSESGGLWRSLFVFNGFCRGTQGLLWGRACL